MDHIGLHRHAMPVKSLYGDAVIKEKLCRELYLQSTNENKMKEIRKLLSDFSVEIFSLKEA